VDGLVEQFSVDSPLRLSREQTEANMTVALASFETYLEYLAIGKLDGYLDSIRPEDKAIVPKTNLPRTPILLLHDLGKRPDQERITKLFINDTVFVVSGQL